MNTIPQLFNIASDLYNKLARLVNEMYDLCGDKASKSRQDILHEFNGFIQAILIKVAVADEKFLLEEYTFVKDLVGAGNFIEEENLQYEDLDKLVARSNEFLKRVPEFIKLSVLADKTINEKLIIKNPTYCQIVYDNLKRIANYLKFYDCDLDEREDIIDNTVLKEIISYYKKNYVTYARRRKE